MRKLAFLLVCLLALPAAGQPWSGSGTEGDPYQIWDACDMQAIGANSVYWDAHFKLMADIDLGGFTGTSFNIIGNDSNAFTGVFDGNGYMILNFSYTGSDANFVGVFGYVATEDAEIKDLGLIDPNIDAETNGGYIGSLVGYLDSASLTNSYVKDGSVCGGRDIRIGNGLHFACVGGLVGAGQIGTIAKCHASSLVRGNASFVGGLVGAYDGTISNCFGTSIVSGNGFATGGLVGLSGGIISNSYAAGTVDGNEWTGGLIGEGFFCEVSNCYATGDVNGNDFTSGLTGLQWFGSYTKCFWDSDINPDVNGIGNLTDPNVMGKSTAEMQTESTFTSVGWDFVGETVNGANDIWWINEGKAYPRLWWETIELMELLDTLAQDIIDLELQPGIENSLLAKLGTALQILEDENENNDIAAINTLGAFINAVEAQRGKKIPEAEADALIAAAQEIIELLSDG